MTAGITLQDFLIALHPPESGPTELRALPSKRRTFVNATDTDATERFLGAHTNENLYLGVATRRDASSGELENCAELHAIFADIDFKSDVHPNGIPESEGRTLIERFPLQPSVVVNSGGGLYLYFLLREPINLQDRDDCQRAYNLLRRLARALGGDLASAEPARILRVPGTRNFKYDPPRHVEIETFEPERQYNLCDLDDFLPEEPRTNGNGHREGFRVPEAILDGKRNDTLFRLARSLYARRMSQAATLAALRAENEVRCVPPLPEAEVLKIVQHAFRQADRSGFTVNEQQANASTQGGASITEYRLSDVGNAARFAAMHGHDLRYVGAWGRWLCWDGVRWQPDEIGEVMRRAREVATSVYREAAAESDEVRRKALSQHAVRLDSDGKLRAMLHLAESEPAMAVRGDVFDRDPWLFNCQNGTLDLRTGELYPHRREDYITKLSLVAYDPSATCPAWGAFLRRIFAEDSELIAYVQRVAGYCLSGDVSEQGLDIFYGTGANGKSTLLKALLAMMGDYGKQAAPGLLMRKYGETHPTEIADLRGARLAVMTEVEEGQRLAEVLTKQLTGGDRLKARLMRQDFEEFDPTFKIVMAVNHLPRISGTDHALWRRIRTTPFQVTIPDEEQDKRLAEKLKAELPAILAWAVRGCLEWQRGGLAPPPQVGRATAAYRAEMDTIGDFLRDRTKAEPSGVVTAKAIYAAYIEWCEGNGERPLSQKQLGSRLTERGFARRRGRQGHLWIGLMLECDP